MKLEGEQTLFRIFMRAGDKYRSFVPLYRYIVKKMKDDDMAGATVIMGNYGFLGSRSDILKGGFLTSQRLPVCVEVVDFPERINRFIDNEWHILENLILTSERARVIIYTSDKEVRQNEKNRLSFIEKAKESRRNEIMLKKKEECVLIRTFIGDSDREKGGSRYLYEFITEEAKKLGFALAFSYKGVIGYGKKSRLREIDTIEFSSNLPLCVELIGGDEQAQQMIDILDQHVESGLVTVEKVTVYCKK